MKIFYLLFLLSINLNIHVCVDAAENGKQVNPLQRFMDDYSQEEIFDSELNISLIVTAKPHAFINFKFVDNIDNDIAEKILRKLQFEKKLQAMDHLAAQAYIYYKQNSQPICHLSYWVRVYEISGGWRIIDADNYGFLFCQNDCCYSKQELIRLGFTINSFGGPILEDLFRKYPSKAEIHAQQIAILESYLNYNFSHSLFLSACKKFTLQEAQKAIQSVLDKATDKDIALNLIQNLEEKLQYKIEYIKSQIQHKYKFDQESLRYTGISGVTAIGCSIASVYIWKISKNMKADYTKVWSSKALCELASLELGIVPWAAFLTFLYNVATKDPNEDNQYLPMYQDLLSFVMQLQREYALKLTSECIGINKL